MTHGKPKYALVCGLLLVLEILGTNGYAKPQQQTSETSPVLTTGAKDKVENDASTKLKDDPYDSVVENHNALGVPFLKNLVADQKGIWTSPAHLRWRDGTWLFPLAAATGGFFA